MELKEQEKCCFKRTRPAGISSANVRLMSFCMEMPRKSGGTLCCSVGICAGKMFTPIDPDDLLFGRSHVGNSFRPTDKREAGHMNLDEESLLKKSLGGRNDA